MGHHLPTLWEAAALPTPWLRPGIPCSSGSPSGAPGLSQDFMVLRLQTKPGAASGIALRCQLHLKWRGRGSLCKYQTASPPQHKARKSFRDEGRLACAVGGLCDS